MHSKFRRKPSPALVVALVALGAAVAGTAFAEPLGLTDRQLEKIKAIAKNRANKQINKRAPNLTVDDSAHLGAFGPSFYTTQAKHDTLLNPLTLTEATQTVLETSIEVPSQRSITGIATVEATATGPGQSVSCNIQVGRRATCRRRRWRPRV